MLRSLRSFAVGLALTLGTATAHAALYVYEGFDYTVNLADPIAGQLNGQTGGTGLSGAWEDMTSGSNAGIPFLYNSAGNTNGTNDLDTPGIPQPNWDGVVDNIAMTGGYVGLSPYSNVQFEDRINARRTLAQSAGAMAGADRTLWASMVVHYADNRFFFAPGFALTDGGGFQDRVQNLSDTSTGLGIGNGGPPINDGRNGPDVTLSHYDFGTRDELTKTAVGNLSTAVADYVIVLKYVFGDSSDQVSAWFFAETDTIDEATFNTNAPTMTTSLNVDENTLTTLAVGTTRARNTFDEIRIGDTFADVTPAPTPQFSPADLDQDGDVDDADFGIAFAAFTGPNNGPSNNPAADLDNDGDVDDADFGIAFAAFTGPGGPGVVPEPASLALLGLGGLLFARRRRA